MVIFLHKNRTSTGHPSQFHILSLRSNEEGIDIAELPSFPGRKFSQLIASSFANTIMAHDIKGKKC